MNQLPQQHSLAPKLRLSVCLSARVCRNLLLIPRVKLLVLEAAEGRKLSKWWKLLMESAEGEGGLHCCTLLLSLSVTCSLLEDDSEEPFRVGGYLVCCCCCCCCWSTLGKWCDALSMHTLILCSINKKKKKRFSKERERIAWQLAARRRKKSDGRMRRMQKRNQQKSKIKKRKGTVREFICLLLLLLLLGVQFFNLKPFPLFLV